MRKRNQKKVPATVVGTGVSVVLSAQFVIAAVVTFYGFSGISPGSFDAFRYFSYPILSTLLLVVHAQRVRQQQLSQHIELFDVKDRAFYNAFFSVFLFLVLGALFEDVSVYENYSLGFGIWLLACLGQLSLVRQEYALCMHLKRCHEMLSRGEALNAADCMKTWPKEPGFTKQDFEDVFQSVAVNLQLEGVIEEFSINEQTWFFNRTWHEGQLTKIDASLAHKSRYSEDEIHAVLQSQLRLPKEESRDYAERFVSCGTLHPFEDGDYFVHHVHASSVKLCASCGIAHSANDENYASDWFCSDLCKETEASCEQITSKESAKRVSDAGTAGFTVVAGAQAWRENQKVVAIDGQGHGFAAEQVNHRIDTLMGKKATIVGGDNAKHGADRLVDGRLIQTKYCTTARRSVGAGFDGSDGKYLYMDTDGKPMHLEVPKDQYVEAVKVFEQKIRDGKVPGVTDPAQAKEIVVKGHITHNQAVNIVKFGTFESIAYDMSEGTVVGLAAGGISFGITATIYYVNTRDSKEAVRIALLQGGKTFGKTLAIYVGVQQLHRLAAVQSVLKLVDVNAFSPSVRTFLQKGFGVSRNGLNGVLRGTIVTSIVLVAVTTGPDLIKLIRGRMSKAQFVKNLVVASSSVAGGVAGSMVGGVAGAALGPAGAVVGRFLGGLVGGMAAAVVSDKLMGAIIKEDRVKMVAILQVQIEYLARTFILSEGELERLRDKLDAMLTSTSIQELYASTNRRALANSLIKPAVVSIVRERPRLAYTANDIIDVCEEMAA